MARGRFISESVATDARLNSLSVEAELVYLMTVPHLDRDGLIDGDPDVLWGKVCPKRRQFLDAMTLYIEEWIRAELVVSYETPGGAVLWFKGFAKNQVGLRYERESPSRFPPPPHGKDSQPAGSSPATVRQPSDNCLAQLEVQGQLEVKDQGRDHARVTEPPAPPKPTHPPAVAIFLEFCTKTVNRTQTDTIASTVVDLDLWRRVLTEWSLRGHNTANVNGLLDWYRDGIPHVSRNGGQHGSNQQRGQPDHDDNAPTLDPAIERQFEEQRARKRARAAAP